MLEDIRNAMRVDGVGPSSLSVRDTVVGDARRDGGEIGGFASLAPRLRARVVLATL